MQSQEYNQGVQAEVQQLFTHVDKDRSGKISQRELQAALITAQGSNFSDTACNLMISMFDHDRSGTIDVHEFQLLYSYINQWLAVFRSCDKDQTGHIEEGELSHEPQADVCGSVYRYLCADTEVH
ncbi:PREDICTED: peflin-like isoform X2 [Nicrophorus vespilloides]|uniref:Peflin-like isoform X2 n=1 Tax=Nicrophorus vespilloides TaxID=110193 RepID=A0ABM1MAB5_NICVS|nr:PREDICTED: peflin-like isoform X2 [Nicrophorus vespilloides]